MRLAMSAASLSMQVMLINYVRKCVKLKANKKIDFVHFGHLFSFFVIIHCFLSVFSKIVKECFPSVLSAFYIKNFNSFLYCFLQLFYMWYCKD